MHLVILSGAARPRAKSNTAKIIDAFREGFEAGGNTAEVWYLADRRQWPQAAEAFARSRYTLIALPLYVENIPGILLEFLSGLQPRETPGAVLSFLLQGGFPEACQRRCCEAYLETLPSQLGCEFGGTLSRGDLFGTGLVDERTRAKLLAPFTEAGRAFSGRFDKAAADAFSGAEHMSAWQIRMYNLVGRRISRFYIGRIAKKLGCRGRLDARPYGEETP